MVLPHQFTYWLIVASLFLALPVLAGRLYDRRELIVEALERYGARISARRLDESHDPYFEDLARALRQERLRADFERLRHLITVDEYMSATRQIANRLVYHQLRKECALEFGPAGLDRLSTGGGDPWRAAPAYPMSPVANDDRSYRPRVETLDIRW